MNNSNEDIVNPIPSTMPGTEQEWRSSYDIAPPGLDANPAPPPMPEPRPNSAPEVSVPSK